MEEQEIYKHKVECPGCFLNWSYESDQMIEELQKICEYCVAHPIMTSKQLLTRRIDVVHSSYAYRFPEVMKHLLSHVELKD